MLPGAAFVADRLAAFMIATLETARIDIARSFSSLFLARVGVAFEKEPWNPPALCRYLLEDGHVLTFQQGRVSPTGALTTKPSQSSCHFMHNTALIMQRTHSCSRLGFIQN